MENVISFTPGQLVTLPQFNLRGFFIWRKNYECENWTRKY